MVAYSFKERFVLPIAMGLGQKLCRGIEIPKTIIPKRQTIRAIGKRRHARPGEVLQLYTGMRTKQCRSIGVAKCTAVRPVSINVHEHQIIVTIDGTTIGGGGIHDFAKRDGFAAGEDMLAFWKKEHGLGMFHGLLIRWEPIR